MPDAPLSVPSAAKSKSSVQMICESVVDAVAIVVTAALMYAGKVPSDLGLLLIGALAGVRVLDLFGARTGGGGPPTSGPGLGGLAGLVIAVGGALTGVLGKSVARIGASVAVAGLVLTALAAGVLGACYHRDGSPYSAADYGSFGRQVVATACAMHRVGGPLVLALAGGNQYVTLVEHEADQLCALATSTPSATAYARARRASSRRSRSRPARNEARRRDRARAAPLAARARAHRRRVGDRPRHGPRPAVVRVIAFDPARTLLRELPDATSRAAPRAVRPLRPRGPRARGPRALVGARRRGARARRALARRGRGRAAKKQRARSARPPPDPPAHPRSVPLFRPPTAAARARGGRAPPCPRSPRSRPASTSRSTARRSRGRRTARASTGARARSTSSATLACGASRCTASAPSSTARRSSPSRGSARARGLLALAAYGMDSDDAAGKGKRIGAVARLAECDAVVLDAEGRWEDESRAAEGAHADALRKALRDAAPDAYVIDQPWPVPTLHWSRFPYEEFARCVNAHAPQFYFNDWKGPEPLPPPVRALRGLVGEARGAPRRRAARAPALPHDAGVRLGRHPRDLEHCARDERDADAVGRAVPHADVMRALLNRHAARCVAPNPAADGLSVTLSRHRLSRSVPASPVPPQPQLAQCERSLRGTTPPHAGTTIRPCAPQPAHRSPTKTCAEHAAGAASLQPTAPHSAQR
jgi:hypothetical protein